MVGVEGARGRVVRGEVKEVPETNHVGLVGQGEE